MDKPNNCGIRVGIDFGKVIGLDDDPNPVPLAFVACRHCIGQFGPENVFIVSKAGEEMEQRICKWLNDHSFYDVTRLRRSHVIFVRTYEDKAHVACKLQLNWFIDDQVKVIRCMTQLECMTRVFWFGAGASDLDLIPDKQHRAKLVIASTGWKCVLKSLSKFSSARGTMKKLDIELP